MSTSAFLHSLSLYKYFKLLLQFWLIQPHMYTVFGLPVWKTSPWLSNSGVHMNSITDHKYTRSIIHNWSCLIPLINQWIAKSLVLLSICDPRTRLFFLFPYYLLPLYAYSFCYNRMTEGYVPQLKTNLFHSGDRGRGFTSFPLLVRRPDWKCIFFSSLITDRYHQIPHYQITTCI